MICFSVAVISYSSARADRFSISPGLNNTSLRGTISPKSRCSLFIIRIKFYPSVYKGLIGLPACLPTCFLSYLPACFVFPRWSRGCRPGPSVTDIIRLSSDLSATLKHDVRPRETEARGNIIIDGGRGMPRRHMRVGGIMSATSWENVVTGCTSDVFLNAFWWSGCRSPQRLW